MEYNQADIWEDKPAFLWNELSEVVDLSGGPLTRIAKGAENLVNELGFSNKGKINHSRSQLRCLAHAPRHGARGCFSTQMTQIIPPW
jgi:hypothetical protein